MTGYLEWIGWIFCPTFNPLDSSYVGGIFFSDGNYQFSCVDLNGQTMENGEKQAATGYFWYYVACTWESLLFVCAACFFF